MNNNYLSTKTKLKVWNISNAFPSSESYKSQSNSLPLSSAQQGFVSVSYYLMPTAQEISIFHLVLLDQYFLF